MKLEKLKENLETEANTESTLLENIANICFDKFLIEKGKRKKAKLVLQTSSENLEVCDSSPP